MSEKAFSVVKILKELQQEDQDSALVSPRFFEDPAPSIATVTHSGSMPLSLDQESKDLIQTLIDEMKLHNDIELQKLKISQLKDQLAEQEEKLAEEKDQQRFEKIKHSLYV